MTRIDAHDFDAADALTLRAAGQKLELVTMIWRMPKPHDSTGQ
jgi:hypothetical protein